MRDRSADNMLGQHRCRVVDRVQTSHAVDFFNLLTSPELLTLSEAHLPEHRERLYPPTVTLSMFLQQVLDSDRSCQHAVNGWAMQRVAEGLSPKSIDTGAYCKARKRLPVEMVRALMHEIGHSLSTRALSSWRWRNRPVKLVDGTTISMPDTPDNQRRYPSLPSQARGVGCPLARVVGLICLSTGAVLAAAHDAFIGKTCGETALFRRLLWALAPGDVLLGDALYCHYFLIASLQASAVDAVFEQHGGRRTDFRRGQRLGARDHIVQWRKPHERPAWMTPEQYLAYPDTLSVREVRVNGRVLVTTLCDARAVPKSQVNTLYVRRWQVELDLRNIKTTLGMSVLSCKSPSMIETEIWVYLLAYNLIRLLMAQAALKAGLHPRQLSFKHTVQLWTHWIRLHVGARGTDATVILFQLIAQHIVGNRSGRVEPRARKRRIKSYPWLKIPRDQARKKLTSCMQRSNA